MQPSCLVCRFRMTEMNIESLSVPKRNRLRRGLGELSTSGPPPPSASKFPARKIAVRPSVPANFPPVCFTMEGTSDNTAWLPSLFLVRPFALSSRCRGTRVAAMHPDAAPPWATTQQVEGAREIDQLNNSPLNATPNPQTPGQPEAHPHHPHPSPPRNGYDEPGAFRPGRKPASGATSRNPSGRGQLE